jgi:ABC-type Fe3+/spermidine/putrescine transport system ATPase subunit
MDDRSHTRSAISVDVAKGLRDFDLRVQFETNARRIVLFGSSGAGKSVTLQMVAGTVRPERGRIEVASNVLFDSDAGINLPNRARGTGYVPQGYALFPHLTVEQNIGFGLKGKPRAEQTSRIDEMLRLIGLEDVRRERTLRLSGGQQQRVAIARSLAPSPHILLLDEPFSALDPVLRPRLRDEIIGIQEELDVPLIAVTHDLADAFRLAQLLVVIDRGAVLQQGSPHDVFYRPATAEVARLVGITNVVEARVIGVEDGAVVVEWDRQVLRSEFGEVSRPHAFSPGQDVHVCIRPTHVMIRLPNRSYEGRQNVLSGRIVDEIPGAERHQLFVRVTSTAHPHDIEVELPGYAYHRLELDHRKDIEMSIRPALLHVIPVM